MSKRITVKLSYIELAYIVEHLDLNQRLEDLLKNRTLDFVMSEDDADELRNLCTDKLDVSGFDEAYNPTDSGEILEALIDKLFVG